LRRGLFARGLERGEVRFRRLPGEQRAGVVEQRRGVAQQVAVGRAAVGEVDVPVKRVHRLRHAPLEQLDEAGQRPVRDGQAGRAVRRGGERGLRPLLGGPRVVTYPNPLDAQKLVETIEKHKLQLLITTPTFLRAFLRKAKPEQLRSLKMVVTGAEKLPLDLLREFESKFGIQVSEGYGMTEASPVVAVNLFDEPPSRMNPDGVLGRRIGSVGRMVPGMTARIRDPETGEELDLFQSGMLWLRGANVFEGYFKETDQTTAVLQEGWYKTGDVGRLDEDGFLFIEGRMSRFSKIAGEMVPHLTVEQRIVEALDLHPAHGEGPAVAVVGLPDEKRGESLVVLTTVPVEQPELRKRLVAMGLPNLWIPKVVKKVAAIPIMATGKLDLRACHRLAEQAATPTETPVAPVTGP